MPTLFLVEPDATQREWCRLHLDSAGFAVVAFDEGRRALDSLRAQPPDLVLIATGLGGDGAFALGSAIREATRSTPAAILFLVPQGDSATLAKALALDPRGALAKPLTRERLLKAIDDKLGEAASAPSNAPAPEPTRDSAGAQGTSSGPLLETKQATVLVVGVRNFVSLARSLSAVLLDRLLTEFASHARQAVFDAGGWIVSSDALSMVALFENVPSQESPHSARALEAALGTVLASRAAKRWGEFNLPNRMSVDVSVGCGIHAGEVIVARLTVGGRLAPSIAGHTANLAQRLEGRAKGLRWSIACSESAFRQAGSRYEPGYRSSLTDTDHGTTIPIVEIRGYMPGSARPGQLARVGAVSEAMLANSLLASLAGDVDQDTADRTIYVRATGPSAERLPVLPGRRVDRRIRHSTSADAYIAIHLQTHRRELVKVLATSAWPGAYIERYLDDYRLVRDIQHRNVVTVHDIATRPDLAMVALEFVEKGTLLEALHRQLSIGASLNGVAQACMAIDAIHAAGITHGNLAPEHFRFRADGALVLTDFNTSRRVSMALGTAEQAGRLPEPATPRQAEPRADFDALGRILHALLTGDRSLLAGKFEAGDRAGLERASRLPLALTPIQGCIDVLLGLSGQDPAEQAQDALVALMAAMKVFPIDPRDAVSLAAGVPAASA